MDGQAVPLDPAAARSELTKHPYRIKAIRLRVQSEFQPSVNDCGVMVAGITEPSALSDALELVAGFRDHLRHSNPDTACLRENLRHLIESGGAESRQLSLQRGVVGAR